ncbi:thiolase family protein [Pyrobaculum arsenaticum]|uniref:Acetyl-CoA acetyltransferase n=2 Tax=Pyrobaculum arsenaticum TaxID=121277 RepID=A4WHQ4_PYRAR|nr:thiolase family protein [Pyrobaculum arsenaticum]ABP49921.1 acetyl-CoA acetyltransferase [Pyrobaculum arsenaticum DSM 13514]NYR15906.1 thiolase family protein [Pyrobaculum arsenaticum]
MNTNYLATSNLPSVEVVIVGYARTPIGKFGGGLKDVKTAHLAAFAIRKALDRAGVEGKFVDEVIIGSTLQGGQGQSLARQAALYAGLPVTTSAYTVNRVCSSGMQAVIEAYREIALGDADIVVAGGAESMSTAPLAFAPEVRWGVKHLIGRGQQLLDLMVYDGLTDPVNGLLMGEEAEMVAKEWGLTRQELDLVAYESHMRAWRATENKWFLDLEPIDDVLGGVRVKLDRDEGIRPDTTVEKLAKLKPAFKPDGVLTAGNSSQLSDGAAVLVLASADKAKELGLKPVAKVLGYSWHMVEPWRFIEAPIYAVQKLFKKLGMDASQFDYFENNEAFAVNNVLFHKALQVPYDKLNVFGGAIALGHPLGASGARIITTLISVLKVKGGRRGIAALCHGTGGGTALAVELI